MPLRTEENATSGDKKTKQKQQIQQIRQIRQNQNNRQKPENIMAIIII
jgi:hypothetical protein